MKRILFIWQEWNNGHRVYFLNMLFQSVVELKQVKYIMDILIPDIVRERSNLYLLGCYDIHSMFIELYEPANSNHFVSLKDIAFNVKNSTDFRVLTKIKQRGMKNDIIYEFFKTMKIINYAIKNDTIVCWTTCVPSLETYLQCTN